MSQTAQFQVDLQSVEGTLNCGPYYGSADDASFFAMVNGFYPGVFGSFNRASPTQYILECQNVIQDFGSMPPAGYDGDGTVQLQITHTDAESVQANVPITILRRNVYTPPEE